MFQTTPSRRLPHSSQARGIEASLRQAIGGLALLADEWPDARVCATCGAEQAYRPVGQRTPGGQIYRRDECPCEVSARAERLAEQAMEQEKARKQAWFLRQRMNQAQSGLTAQLGARFTFESYDGQRSAGQGAAKKLAVGWARDFVPGCQGLALSGADKGTGKTHLLIAATWEVLQAGHSVLFLTSADLLARIRADISTGRESTLELARTATLLSLDDVGVERIAEGEKGDWAREVLFRIVDHRSLHGLTTCFTSNQTPAEMAVRLGGETGDRIVSRLAGLTLWRSLAGPDGRMPSTRGGAK